MGFADPQERSAGFKSGASLSVVGRRLSWHRKLGAGLAAAAATTVERQLTAVRPRMLCLGTQLGCAADGTCSSHREGAGVRRHGFACDRPRLRRARRRHLRGACSAERNRGGAPRTPPTTTNTTTTRQRRPVSEAMAEEGRGLWSTKVVASEASVGCRGFVLVLVFVGMPSATLSGACQGVDR